VTSADEDREVTKENESEVKRKAQRTTGDRKLSLTNATSHMLSKLWTSGSDRVGTDGISI
jgi:hypothetical protein